MAQPLKQTSPTVRTKSYDVNYSAFVDDTELYVHYRCDQMLSTIQRLERCIYEIGQKIFVHVMFS